MPIYMVVVRKSNFELLRIIAMCMVLVVHIVGPVHGLPSNSIFSTVGDAGVIAFEAVGIICVNLFVIVSGYFGIKLSWRGLLRYVGLCGFYSVAITIAAALAFPSKAGGLQWWLDSIFFLSRNDLWFVTYYFFLMILSPMLNAAVDKMTHRSMVASVASLLLLSCYFGWLNGGEVNPRGYNLTQMITLYVLGRYIGVYLRNIIETQQTKLRKVSLAVYMVSYVLIVLSTFVVPVEKAFYYNSPMVMMASVSFFLVFATFEFSSSMVNYIAGSAFAVYLIHKHPLVWGALLLPWWRSLDMSYDGIMLVAVDAAAIIAVFSVCVLADMLRRVVVARCLKKIGL